MRPFAGVNHLHANTLHKARQPMSKVFNAGEALRPALDVSIVAPILLLRGVPARMPDVTIRVECNGGHGVVDIMRPESGPPGEVFVEFEELR